MIRILMSLFERECLPRTLCRNLYSSSDSVSGASSRTVHTMHIVHPCSNPASDFIADGGMRSTR